MNHRPARVGVFNVDTGEKLPDMVLSVSNRRSSAMSRGAFFMVDQDKGGDMMRAIAGSRLPGESLRVLFAMLPYLDYDNAILVGHAHLTAVCGISRPAVSRAIRRLVEFGVLVESFRLPGGGVSYTLNPSMVWKGDKARRSAAILAFKSKAQRADAVPV